MPVGDQDYNITITDNTGDCPNHGDIPGANGERQVLTSNGSNIVWTDVGYGGFTSSLNELTIKPGKLVRLNEKLWKCKKHGDIDLIIYLETENQYGHMEMIGLPHCGECYIKKYSKDYFEGIEPVQKSSLAKIEEID